MKYLIIPTILAHSKKEFQQRFDSLVPISKDIQIDFMDGKFVPSKSIKLSKIPNLKSLKNNFEAHLMVKKPNKYISKLSSKGFKKFIFHIESQKSPQETLKLIRKIKALNLQVFLALNPETSIGSVLPFFSEVDGLLVMGVHPGKEHQSLIPKTLDKIKKLKSFNKKIPIQVDGGLSPKNLKSLLSAGASILNSGSFVSDSKDPKSALKKLYSLSK